MAAHNVQASAQTNAAKMESKRIKWNIIKTMIIVSGAIVICWSPIHILHIVGYARYAYNATVCLAYLYICMNPFIYAIKHDGVKQTLAGLMVRFRRAISGVDP